MREKNKLAFLIVGTILIIVLFVILLFYYKATKEECINNPLVYGINKLSKNNLTVMCTCYFNDIRYSPFYITKNNITVGLPY